MLKYEIVPLKVQKEAPESQNYCSRSHNFEQSHLNPFLFSLLESPQVGHFACSTKTHQDPSLQKNGFIPLQVCLRYRIIQKGKNFQNTVLLNFQNCILIPIRFQIFLGSFKNLKNLGQRFSQAEKHF